MQVDWELSQSLTSDGQGIRGVAVASNSLTNNGGGADSLLLITGSQAGTMMEYGVPSGNLTTWSFQHDNTVTAILCIGSKDETVVTGSKDAQIRLFDRASQTLLATLKGHDKPVTSLACTGNYLVSGSWDGTAKIWNWTTNACLATLPNHENSTAVAILGIDDNNASLQVVTVSAGEAHNNQIQNHTVRLWNIDLQTGQATKIYQVANDHEGPIRDVCLLPNDTSQIATCSNDGTVKLRAPENGTCLDTLTFIGNNNQQHPPMLLSVCATTDGCVIASAEDGQVIVWDISSAAGSSPQIIPHASCVWRVHALPNGDFCTACDDGVVRIFTRATERQASAEERQAFSESVQAAMAQKQGGPSPEEVAKLPRWENNFEKRGTSEGQVQLFQKDGIAIAAQWSAASQTWIEVGQVMGNAGGGGAGNDAQGGILDGVQYDFILPIEVENAGSVVNLKIGYNTGENPFTAAQRFIDAHMLPQYHLAQIADYIQQRTGSATGGAPMLGMDTSPTPVATTGVPMASFEHIPAQHLLAFELSAKSATTTLEKMKTKLAEFGKLNENEMNSIDGLMQVILATSRYHASKVENLNVLATGLQKLEPGQTFPMLDLARLAVLHPHAADASHQFIWQNVLEQNIQLFSSPASQEGPAIPMLSFRLFANALKGGPGSQKAIVSLLDRIIQSCVVPHVTSSNKNVRLSLATFLYNAAVHAKLAVLPANSLPLESMINAIASILTSYESYEEPATMRVLQTLGTLCLTYSAECKPLANGLFLASKVEPAASPHSSTVKAAAKEVYNVLQ